MEKINLDLKSDLQSCAKMFWKHIFSLISYLFPLPPLAMLVIVRALHCDNLCYHKITIFNIDMGEGGEIRSDIAEKIGKMCIFQKFLHTIADANKIASMT